MFCLRCCLNFNIMWANIGLYCAKLQFLIEILFVGSEYWFYDLSIFCNLITCAKIN